MHIRAVHLQDFRNIGLAHLQLGGGDAFFLGANAQGKTSLLEACGLLTAFRSFRASNLRNLIRHDGSGRASVLIELEHEFSGPTEIEFRVEAKSRSVTVDGERLRRLQDFVGRFPTVAIASDDIELLRGSPQVRRRFLDLSLAGADREYYELLRHYTGALKGRNALLRRGRGGAELSAFDLQLAKSGTALVAKREWAVGVLETDFRELHALYAPEEIALKYRPQLAATEMEAYREALRESLERDLLLGTTSRGPHRDDLKLSVAGRSARDYGSEGQQRGLVLALKLAVFRHFRKQLGATPVILADDVLNELDVDRRRLFWSAIDGDVQVLATGTQPPSGGRGDGWERWTVKEGNFEREAGA